MQRGPPCGALRGAKGNHFWRFQFDAATTFNLNSRNWVVATQLVNVMSSQGRHGTELTQLPKADLLTFWFSSLGSVLVMAPKG